MFVQIFKDMDVIHKEMQSRMLYMELLGINAIYLRHPDDISTVFRSSPELYSKDTPGAANCLVFHFARVLRVGRLSGNHT